MSRVLVVEDSAVERRAMCRVLRRAGHEVAEAGSVSEAEGLLAAGRFDVVLLDLCMPGGDGAQLLPVIEKLVPQPGVAVVSGHIDLARSVALQAWRVVVVLSKPVPPDLLRQAVAMLACPLEEAVLDDFAARAGLTGREAEVLRLVYAAVSTEEIATQIGCASSTVRTHYSNIEAKTGCHSLADVLGALARFAARRRITPPRDLPRVK